MYLEEKRSDRFAQIFNGLPDDPKIQQMIDRGMGFAMVQLRRQDRIVWWLRLWRLMIDDQLVKANPQNQQLEQAFKKKGMRLLQKNTEWANKNSTPAPMTIDPEWPRKREAMTRLDHFSNLESSEVQAVVWDWQCPETLIDQLEKAEAIWQERLDQEKQWIDMEEDDLAEEIMTFDDGFAWWNLNRPYCEIEGNAMGHCGNTAERKGTVLSLRHYDETRGRWRPVATFILDEETGMLGEMKGRANKKPEAKYHKYIVELLRHHIITGIRGGGYAPEENFSLNDLNRKDYDDLTKEKPELLGLVYLWKKAKKTLSQDVLKQIHIILNGIDRGLDNTFVRRNGQGQQEYYVPMIDGKVRYETFKTIDDLVRNFGFSMVEELVSMMRNQKDFDTSSWTEQSWLDTIHRISPPAMEKLRAIFGNERQAARMFADRKGPAQQMVSQIEDRFSDQVSLKDRIEEYFPYMQGVLACDVLGIEEIDNKYHIVSSVSDYVSYVMRL